MDADIERIILHRDAIHARVRALGAEIAAVYESAEPRLTLVPILSGSIIFLADLIRELPLKMQLALMHVSSYPGRATSSTGTKVISEPIGHVQGRHVLIIDDILDSGRTIRAVREVLLAREPASLRTAVLLRKPSKAPPDLPVEFIGFDIEDLFVVGYGLDYGDHYRNYPHVGVLRRELM